MSKHKRKRRKPRVIVDARQAIQESLESYDADTYMVALRQEVANAVVEIVSPRKSVWERLREEMKEFFGGFILLWRYHRKRGLGHE